MTPGVQNTGDRILGIGAAGGLMSGLSAFFVGAFVAGTVLSFIKKDGGRLAGALIKSDDSHSHDEKTLEELIAEKERLEDLIAETAAQEEGKS